MELYCVVGTNQALAIAEIKAVASRFSPVLTVETIHPQVVKIITSDFATEKFLTSVGSVVKIITPLTGADTDPEKMIAQDIKNHGHEAFVVNSFDEESDLSYISRQVKTILKVDSYKSRFRIVDNPLTSAGIPTPFSEYFIDLPTHSVYKTAWVQDLTRWSQKDAFRPAPNQSMGMLPPKVARMMINIAVSSKDPTTLHLLDPFCGSGTICMEALELGMTVIGTDIAQKAVSSTQKNLDWYTQHFTNFGTYTVKLADATHITTHDVGGLVDVIVFEGDLGPPHLAPEKISNILKGLGKLYTGTFKNISRLIKQGGVIVCALPEYTYAGQTRNLDTVIEACEKYGLVQTQSPLSYFRTKAQVRRRIYLLQKT